MIIRKQWGVYRLYLLARFSLEESYLWLRKYIDILYTIITVKIASVVPGCSPPIEKVSRTVRKNQPISITAGNPGEVKEDIVTYQSPSKLRGDRFII